MDFAHVFLSLYNPDFIVVFVSQYFRVFCYAGTLHLVQIVCFLLKYAYISCFLCIVIGFCFVCLSSRFCHSYISIIVGGFMSSF